jgi:hypothetical protein
VSSPADRSAARADPRLSTPRENLAAAGHAHLVVRRRSHGRLSAPAQALVREGRRAP